VRLVRPRAWRVAGTFFLGFPRGALCDLAKASVMVAKKLVDIGIKHQRRIRGACLFMAEMYPGAPAIREALSPGGEHFGLGIAHRNDHDIFIGRCMRAFASSGHRVLSRWLFL